MNDKKFDKMIKEKVQRDEYIDEKVNELFSVYKEKYKKEKVYESMKENSNIFNFMQKMKYVAAVLVVGLILGTGGMTYAHINGVETIISPVLRMIGINSKYEENATDINETITDNSVEIKMLNAAIDESTLIVGYTIFSENINMLHWIDVNGNYKINGISINPISESIDKDLETKFLYYQIFDLSEIKFNSIDNLLFTSNIFEILEYTEVEGLESATAENIKSYSGNWSFNEEIPVKNINENKTYELKSEGINTNGIVINAKEVVRSSYTNMIKIETNKNEYKGNSFEELYIVYDENNNEIVASSNEQRDFDYQVYTDRMFIENLNTDSKLRIDVYINYIDVGKFEKVGSIDVDMSKAKEVQGTDSGYKTYNSDEYSFKYNDNWEVLCINEKNHVGPYSRYVNCLHIEAPSTTNEDTGMTIFVGKNNNEGSIEEYIDDLIDGYEKEYSELIAKNICKIGALNGYEVITKIYDNVSIDYIVEANGNIYYITFSANEKEYNNQKDEIKELVESFEIK